MPLPVHQDSRFGLVDALNAEWQRWSRDSATVRDHGAEIGRWAEQHAALAGCTTPDQVLEAIRRTPDEVLAALIATHQRLSGSATGGISSTHPLAGRIILQTMLGKLVTMARRDLQRGVEDYVGQLWLQIAGYPLESRPRRIAANLCLDTLKAVTADRRGWTAPGGEPVLVTPAVLEGVGLDRKGSLDDPVAGPDPDQVADLTAHRVLRTAQRMGLVDEATRALLHTVYVDGLTSSEAAGRHGLTATTVRARCSVAVRRLARHAEEIADVA